MSGDKCIPVWQVKHLFGNIFVSLASGFFLVSVAAGLEEVSAGIMVSARNEELQLFAE